MLFTHFLVYDTRDHTLQHKTQIELIRFNGFNSSQSTASLIKQLFTLEFLTQTSACTRLSVQYSTAHLASIHSLSDDIDTELSQIIIQYHVIHIQNAFGVSYHAIQASNKC